MSTKTPKLGEHTWWHCLVCGETGIDTGTKGDTGPAAAHVRRTHHPTESTVRPDKAAHWADIAANTVQPD